MIIPYFKNLKYPTVRDIINMSISLYPQAQNAYQRRPPMFYVMVQNKCNEWYNSDQCTVRDLIEYIEKTGQMRDAQIEAIKTYLFLKIKCECKPLETLFKRGFFNTLQFSIRTICFI